MIWLSTTTTTQCDKSETFKLFFPPQRRNSGEIRRRPAVVQRRRHYISLVYWTEAFDSTTTLRCSREKGKGGRERGHSGSKRDNGPGRRGWWQDAALVSGWPKDIVPAGGERITPGTREKRSTVYSNGSRAPASRHRRCRYYRHRRYPKYRFYFTIPCVAIVSAASLYPARVDIQRKNS